MLPFQIYLPPTAHVLLVPQFLIPFVVAKVYGFLFFLYLSIRSPCNLDYTCSPTLFAELTLSLHISQMIKCSPFPHIPTFVKLLLNMYHISITLLMLNFQYYHAELSSFTGYEIWGMET